MKFKCLIVDDEPLAQDILVQYIGDCQSLELSKICSDALEAGEFMQSQPVDLIFLDINMPRLSGIRFVKTLNHPVLIIFTTAYPEFAAEGFEANAVDYLVKPFSFERFMKAVNKAIEWTEFRKKKETCKFRIQFKTSLSFFVLIKRFSRSILMISNILNRQGITSRYIVLIKRSSSTKQLKT